MLQFQQEIIDFLRDSTHGWETRSIVDLGRVTNLYKITNEDVFTEEIKQSSEYDILKNFTHGNRITYLLQVHKITGGAGLLSNVPFIFNAFGASGAINGGVPTKGQVVLIFYVGDEFRPIAVGGAIIQILNRVADGTIPILKSGEQIIQSEIPDDIFDESKRETYKPGASVYLDHKGRLLLRAVQNDGTIDGTVKITLGNPVDDKIADEDANFVSTDPETGNEIVFRLETQSGVTINIDKEGNVHTSILKDYIKECVNEILTLSGDRTESIAGNEEKTVNGYYQLTNSDIRLGGSDVDERLVLGEQWISIMNKLFDAIKNMTFNHPMGRTLPIPITWPQFEAIKTEFSNWEKAVSDISKTKKS